MLERRERERVRPGPAVLASVALHALLGGAMALSVSGAEPAPVKSVKVYSVDIVSPAPNVLGDLPPEPPAPNEGGPGPASVTPAAAPEPAAAPPKPEPPAPEPEPPAPAPATPPPPAPPKTPAPAPTPPPAKTEPAPARTPPKAPAATPTPARPAPARPVTPATRPATPPRATPPTPAKPGATPATGTGTTPRAATPARTPPAGGGNPAATGSGTRSAGTGTRPGAATGRNPDAGSAGGEGLSIRTRGVACPEGYCANVIRQVRRFFRAPEETAGSSGNVCFTLMRDGGVDDIEVERLRGPFQFRIALIEAVEQAGNRKAFGALPAGFDAESLRLCVLMSPETM